MIVCVLLVSNPRRGARQHPLEFDTNNTHTIMFDPLINSLGPHTAHWAKAWDCQSHAVLISLAMLAVPRWLQMPLSRTRIVTKTSYFTKIFMISWYLGVICKNINVNGVS